MKNYKQEVERFRKAQETDWETVREELVDGHKYSHWIWYIFPQLKGFGYSYMSEYYGIDGREEALAYYADDYLRDHLIEATSLVLNHKDKDIREIMGSDIDALKLKSSMTLFWEVTMNPLFKEVLDSFYGGVMDMKTKGYL